MVKKTYVRAQTIYLDEVLNNRLEMAYRTNRRSMKKNAKGQWIRKSRSEFMTDLLTLALDNDATYEGSRLVLAGRFGAKIAAKLDNLQLMLRVLIDLFCVAARITDGQKNAAFQRAAADVNFDQRLEDLRAFYRQTGSDTAASTTTQEGSTSLS